jgi:hypothetical protein
MERGLLKLHINHANETHTIQAGKALASLAAIASQYDGDGLEIQFLNSPTVAANVSVSTLPPFYLSPQH